MAEDKKDKYVYVYSDAGKYQGYVRIEHDEIGDLIGEVYDPDADRLGALKYEPLENTNPESLIFNSDGAQVGFTTFETDAGGVLSGDVYWVNEAGGEPQLKAHIHRNPGAGPNAEVHKMKQWGEKLGELRPENVDEEELILMGGGAALLLLV